MEKQYAVYPDNEDKWEYDISEAVFKGTQKECLEWIMRNGGRSMYNMKEV